MQTLFGTTVTPQSIRDQIAERTAQLAVTDTHQLSYAVNKIEELRGQLHALEQVEDDFADIEQAGAEKGWSAERVLMLKIHTVAKLNMRTADDAWSGRNNDARRCAHDGRQEVLQNVLRDLDNELRVVLAD